MNKVFKITEMQLKLAEEMSLESFTSKMIKHLINCFPSAVFELGNYKEQRVWAKRNIEKAIEFNIRNERNICRYLNVAMTMGESFHREAWAASILNSHTVSETRMQRLNNAVESFFEKQQSAGEPVLNNSLTV